MASLRSLFPALLAAAATAAPWEHLSSGPFSGREGSMAVAYPDGKTLVLVGGRADSIFFLSDVFVSLDGGVSWTQRLKSAPFAGRGYHTLVIDPTNCIVLTGGQSFQQFFNDVFTPAALLISLPPGVPRGHWEGGAEEAVRR